MKKQDIKTLAQYIVITGVLSGIWHAIFNPEPTLGLALGYAVFMGSFVGSGMFIIDQKVFSRKK